jgi:hypothetical protein
MTTKSRRVEVVARILKTRFPTLTDKDTINLAFRIVEALDELSQGAITGNNNEVDR